MSILGINCRTQLSVHIQTTNGWRSCSHHQNHADHWCIPSDSTIVQEFMKAGLPIWFMQPAHTLPGVCIDAIVEPRNPHDFIELLDAETKFNIVFCGSADDLEKRKAFALHSWQFFPYYHPFTLYIIKPRGNVSGTQVPAQGSCQTKFPLICGEDSQQTNILSRSEENHVPKMKAGHPCEYIAYDNIVTVDRPLHCRLSLSKRWPSERAQSK